MRHIAEHVTYHHVLPGAPSDEDEDFKKHLIKHKLWSSSGVRTLTYNTRPDKIKGPALTRTREERRRQHNPAVASGSGGSHGGSAPRPRATIIQQ
ncbi:hypothetical protein NLG97_g8273 [Lecanicillium saksenae]|uniref:Uncharacterized protein n=1 Tax=Lecanicillium saksenae TaxID=468837 RepID=A0ACC1QJH8_9HYPO|nr:hypothetical protein NLG97_g8273 [Lecanicillium saksenae]